MINEETSLGEVIEFFREPPQGGLPRGWEHWINVQEAHRFLANEFLANLPPYPEGKFSGRGVVICAGGHRLFTNGWVAMRILRMHDVDLPIQFWHLDSEIDGYMADLVKPWGVECVDAAKLKNMLGHRCVNGYEIKPFSMLHCPFEEVLLIDADNVAVKSPMFLFDCEQYKENGALFWPDYSKLARVRDIWKVFDTNYDDYPNQHEFESGQVLIDKKRHWQAMNLTVHMNDHSDYYYRFIHGDKCTFEMAWKRLKAPFYLETRTIHALDATMCQHSPVDHSRLFQHRNMDKWLFDGTNRAIGDFWLEKECRDFLTELRAQWNGQPFSVGAKMVNDPALKLFYDELVGKTFVYHRVGHDKRDLELLPAGMIGKGAMGCEKYWSLSIVDGEPLLTISGNSPTCHLKKEGDVWKGRWLNYEKMPIELSLTI
jgi:hypothetical protein